jgi:hypothetical protein
MGTSLHHLKNPLLSITRLIVASTILHDQVPKCPDVGHAVSSEERLVVNRSKTKRWPSMLQLKKH